MVAKSGLGKNAAANAAEAAFQWEGVLGVIDKGRVPRIPLGSGEGLPKTFGYMGNDENKKKVLVRTRESAIITIAEIDTLKGISSRGGANRHRQLRLPFTGETLGFGNRAGRNPDHHSKARIPGLCSRRGTARTR